MDKICGNCGNTQPTEQLVTCQMCRKASEHIYCMRNQLYEVPASWYCEECEEKASGLQNASKRLKTSVGSYSTIEKDKRFKQTPPQDASGRDVPKKRLIKAWSDSPGLITTGNQKPICSQDVSKKTPDSYKVTAISGSSNKPVSRPLSNGTSYKEAKISKTILLEEVTPLRHRVRSGAHRLLDASFHQNVQKSVLSPNTGRARANESRDSNSRSTQVFSEPKRGSVGADKRSSLLARVTKGKNIGGDKIEMTQKTKGLGMSTGRAPAKDSVASNSRSIQVLSERNRGSVGVDRPSSLLTCVARGKNISRDKVETTQKIKDLGSPASCSPTKVMRSDFREENLPLVLAIDPDGKFLTGPASQVCWKGTFEVIDVINIQYSEIRAYFPRMVCSKVYEIMRCLPEKLKFTLSPMRDVWPQIFRAEPPTKDDVGLYFFPCEEERHKEKYARFIERLESRSLAMQTCVNNVHLLLFTSKQLPFDSQAINGEIYMWGIFRNAKSKKRNHDIVRQCHTKHVKNKCVQINVSCKEIAEEVDMEIDMVGGNEIGRIDVPIKKASWLHGFGEPNARDLNYVGTTPLKKVTDPIHSDVSPVISELGPPVLPKLPNSELQSSSYEATPKLTSPMHPDVLPVVSILGPSVPPKLPNSELQSRPYEAIPKLRSPMHPDVPPVFVKFEPSGCPNVPTPRQQSLHGVTSKEVENHIHPDIPPGFGKTEPHKCPKLLTSKQQSSPEPSSMEVKDHMHLDVPPCFVKLEPSGCPNIPTPKQQSLHGATSKEVRSPLYPDIPPGFGKLEPQKCPKLLTPKHQSSPESSSKEMGGHIRLDVPPGSAKLEPSGCPNALTPTQQSSHRATSKEVGSPIYPDIPPGFGKRETHKCPKLLTPRKQSSPVASSKEVGGHIHLDVPLGSVKLEPSGCPNTLTPKQQSLHRATSREVGSPIHPDIPPGFDESEPHKYPKLVTHKQQISPEAVPKEVGGHIHLDVPPGSIKLEPAECLNVPTPKQQGLHRATSKEVGNPIHPDIPPGFGKLELHKCPKLLTHKQPSSSEGSSKEVGDHIRLDVSPGFAEVEPPGFTQLRSSKQESLSRTTSKEAVSRIHPNVPPGFAELRSPGSLNIWAPKHESSSSVDTSKASVSSRMNSREKLAARNVRDWVATSPESHEIQSKHHQVSDLGDKSAKHLGSSTPHSTATNVLNHAVQKRIISSNNSSPGIQKMAGSTEPVPKKQQSSALSVCETESGTPRPKPSDTSKGQNEKGRETEVNVSECISRDSMEEIESIHEILDLNFVPNLASEVSTTSDTQSSTFQPPLGAYHTVSVDSSLAERIARMKKLCNLVPDKKQPDLITLSSDTESGVLLTDHHAKEEEDVSECTSTEATDARHERVLSPMAPELQLFPDAAESVRANGAQLRVDESVGLVSAEMSLSIPQYVKDGNNWIPKSVKERLNRDGCGKELRLSL